MNSKSLVGNVIGRKVNVDFGYFISLALKCKLSWQLLPTILEDFTPTLETSKEVIEVLLKELQKLHSQLLQITKEIKDKDPDVEIIDIAQDDSLPESCQENETTESNQLDIDGSRDNISSEAIMRKTESAKELILQNRSNANHSIIEDIQEDTYNESAKSSICDIPETFIENDTENKLTRDIIDQSINIKENENKKYKIEKSLEKKIENLKTENKYCHGNKEDFKCPICDKSFENANYLKQHEVVHNRNSIFQCNTCRKQFKYKGNLKRHEETHRSEKQFQCQICSYVCKLLHDLKVHEKKHKDENKPHQCQLCIKRFPKNSMLKYHMVTHSKEPQFQCEKCEKKFKHKSYLRTHKKVTCSSINDKESFECKTCNKIFASKDYLKRHSIIHTTEMLFQCKYCEKKFRWLKAIKMHYKMHAGEKPHECNTCGKCFLLRSALKKHETTHTDEKPLQCEICQKSFKHTVGLKIHKVIHTGEKNHECNSCNAKFSKKANLNRHQRTHTGEIPYECKTCGRRFSQWTSLHRHKKEHK